MKMFSGKKNMMVKIISICMVVAFSMSNLVFAQQSYSGNNNTDLRSFDLSPLSGLAMGMSLVLDNKDRGKLLELDSTLADVLGVDVPQWIPSKESKVEVAYKLYTKFWISKLKKKMAEEYDQDIATAEWEKYTGNNNLWESLRSIYIGRYEQHLKAQGKEFNSTIKGYLEDAFNTYRFDTAGTEHIKWGTQASLNDIEQERIRTAVRQTIEADGVVKEVKAEATGGTFVVLDVAKYDLFAEANEADLSVLCNPGTRGTFKNFDPEKNNFDDIEQRYYIKSSLWNQLTAEDKATIAIHEEMHLKIKLGIVKMTAVDKEKYVNEEDFVNHQPGCDARPIMAKLGSIENEMDYAKEKPIYMFGADLEGNNITTGKLSPEWVNLLGGKGANLAGLSLATDENKDPIPVPPGATITTKIAIDYMEENKNKKEGEESVLDPKVIDELFRRSNNPEEKGTIQKLEEATGSKFGATEIGEKPLLLSGRSGARISMPGMMDTVLNIGLNDETVEVLAAQTNDRFAWDSYRRLIMMFGDVVLGVSKNGDIKNYFEHLLVAKKEKVKARIKKFTGVEKDVQDTDLTVPDLKELVAEYKKYIASKGKEFPMDVKEQLILVIKAVFDSSFVERVIKYRSSHNIPEDTLSAVNIQTMVFGNLNDNSATGVCFTRNPSTGEKVFYGEWMRNAQGEDVVSGVRTPMPINNAGKALFMEQHPEVDASTIETLETAMPEAYKHLVAVYKAVEKYQTNMQDMEFTIQDGKLWLLQTRNGKRTATAALNILMDMVDEGLIDKEEALMRLEPKQVDEFLHPIFNLDAKKAAEKEKRLIAKGLGASPGASVGQVAFSPDEVEELKKQIYTLKEALKLITKEGYRIEEVIEKGKISLDDAKIIRAYIVEKKSGGKGADLLQELSPVINEVAQAIVKKSEKEGKMYILVRKETCPDDVGGMTAAVGILTSTGGLTSHAAVVARGDGKTAVVGAEALRIEESKKLFRVGDRIIRQGDMISIDGTTGEIFVGAIETKDSIVVAGLKRAEILERIETQGIEGKEKEELLKDLPDELNEEDQKLFDRFNKFFEWVEEARPKHGVRTNAEKVKDLIAAFKWFKADGIGLARTEHMFFEDGKEGEDRIIKFRKMILTGDEECLKEILQYQTDDFFGILSNVNGTPVTVRLLDPPLHEFLPKVHEFSGTLESNVKDIVGFMAQLDIDYMKTKDIAKLAKDNKISDPQRDVAVLALHLGWTPEQVIGKIEEKKEKNPMAGFRGDRLLMGLASIAETQIRGIFESIIKLKANGIQYSPVEIEIPLIGKAEEFLYFKQMIMTLATEYGLERGRGKDFLLGTMIETPSAAISADLIAPHIDFMSFGTNDLTQFLFKFSRDDAGNIVIPAYMEDGYKILKVNPFQTLEETVVEMVRIATTKAKRANPNIEVGLCGEQGGDPESVGKIFSAGIDFTSCSPYRVLVAKLASAQKLVKDKKEGNDFVTPFRLRDLKSERVGIKRVDVEKTEAAMTEDTAKEALRKLVLLQTPLVYKELAKNIQAVLEPTGKYKDLKDLEKAVVAIINSDIAKAAQEVKDQLNMKELFGSSNEPFIRLFNQDFGSLFEEMDEIEKIAYATKLSSEMAIKADGVLIKEDIKIPEEILKSTMEKLIEFNPAMGLLGARQALTGYTEIYKTQIRAIFETMKENEEYSPRIVVPFLVDSMEFDYIKKFVGEIAEEMGIAEGKYSLGATIETARAALTAGKIAKSADFIIFDNTGLTESVLALTKEDAHSFMPMFFKNGVYPENENPLEVVSESNVGRFIDLATKRAIEAKKDIRIYEFGAIRKDPKSLPVVPIRGDKPGDNVSLVDTNKVSSVEKIVAVNDAGVSVASRFDNNGKMSHIITMHQKEIKAADLLPLLKGINHSLTVENGDMELLFPDKALIAGTVDRKINMGPNLDYSFKKTSSEPLVIKVDYEQPTTHKLSYDIFQAVNKFLAGVKEGKIELKKIDLIIPKEVYGKTNKKKEEDRLNNFIAASLDEKFTNENKPVKIHTYNSAEGLEGAVKRVREGAIPVLVATDVVLTEAKESKKLDEFVNNTRILPIPDLADLNGEAWQYINVEWVSVMQAQVTGEDIASKQGITQDLFNVMKGIRQADKKEFEWDYMYYMLPYSDKSIPEEIKEGITEVISWFKRIIEKIMLSLPMEKVDPKGDFEKQLDFMYSA